MQSYSSDHLIVLFQKFRIVVKSNGHDLYAFLNSVIKVLVSESYISVLELSSVSELFFFISVSESYCPNYIPCPNYSRCPKFKELTSFFIAWSTSVFS